jgi:hypothetical protein
MSCVDVQLPAEMTVMNLMMGVEIKMHLHLVFGMEANEKEPHKWKGLTEARHGGSILLSKQWLAAATQPKAAW